MIETITSVLSTLATDVISFVLLLIPAVIVFLIGKFFAKKISKLTCFAYQKANSVTGCATGNCGTGSCSEGECAGCPKMCKLLSGAVYWVIYVLTLVAVFDILGIAILSDVLSQLILVVPTVIQYGAIGGALAVSWTKREELAKGVDTVIATLFPPKVG